MFNKIKYFLLLTALFSIYSCRSENEVMSANEIPTNKFSTFSTTSPTGKEANTSYARGFAKLGIKYDYINKTNITGLVNIGNSNNKTSSNEPYIEFSIHSKIFTEENSDKWMVFPKIEDGQVVDLIYTILSENSTKLHYYTVNKNSEFFNENVGLFQAVFNQYYSKNNGKNINTESPYARGEGNIEEVVIVVPRSSGGGFPPYLGGGNEPGGNGGGCQPFLDCEAPPEQGGSSSGDGSMPMTPPPPPKTPITDIKKFLSCLNKNQPANLTVYAERYGTDKPGHAFISISQGQNTMVFGFYPKYGFPLNLYGPGQMGNDSNHYYDVAWNIGNINSSQLTAIMDSSEQYSNSNYDLPIHNCTDFVFKIMNDVGIPVSPNGILTPSNLANILDGVSSSIKNGDAPETKRNCP